MGHLSAIIWVCVYLFVFYVERTVLVHGQPDELTRTITTRAGTFKGVVRTLDVFGEEMQIEKYLGVPFAEPPTGPRRFRKPVLKAPMSPSSIYDATMYKPSCKQLDIPLGGIRKPDLKIETAEDCLFLNIYKPFSDSMDTKLAVLMWIHGGGFVCGSPQLFPGDMLSAYTNVIVVSVSYRLAVWGFLSTGDQIAPGNLGLWDQHIALQWVHENIQDFGGDPDNVAIAGMSAGSASVVYQSLFPRNKGLFQRAIAISGSITCPWSFQDRPLDITIRFADLLGCDTKLSTEKIVQCIESIAEEKMHETLNKEEYGYIKYPMEIVSVVDDEFLKASPRTVIHNINAISTEASEFFGSLDFMAANVAGEGAMNLDHFVGIKDAENYAPSREEFERTIVPQVAKLMHGNGVPDVVHDMIVDRYTNWTNPDDINSVRNSFLKMTSDYEFFIHTKLVADLHANITTDKKTFAYFFEAFPSQHLIYTPTWVKTPNHIDDMLFFFGYDKGGILTYTEPYSDDYKPMDWELEVSKFFMALLSNFIKTGDPNKPVDVKHVIGTTWPQYDAHTGKYLAINRSMGKESVREHLFADSYNFWFRLIPKVIKSCKEHRTEHSHFHEDERGYCGLEGNCPP